MNFFPPEHALNICQQLSSCLVGILYQNLLPGKHSGRILASELLINNSAMRNLIRERKYSLMQNVLQTGRSLGMYTFQNSLQSLYDSDMIDQEVYHKYAREHLY